MPLHEGEPNLEQEEAHWLELPEEDRERMMDYIMGEKVDLSPELALELMRNVRWNIIYLQKLLEHSELENDQVLLSSTEGTLDMFLRAKDRLERRFLKDGLIKENES